MAKLILTYEFDDIEDKEKISNIINADKYYSLLWDLDNELRSKLKYGEDSWLDTKAFEYLQHLREEINQGITFE